MDKLKGNKFFTILVICGVLLFAVIAVVLVRATSTVTAIVPNQSISAGTKIDSTMLQTVQIPVNTPKGYITDKSTVLGQKLKVTVKENQLLYISDMMGGWEDFSDGEKIPEDYVVTSIQLPSNRAVGGLITAGDTVDILGVPTSEFNSVSKETMQNYLGEIANDAYGADGINVYWILSNVKILETDSTLSQNNESSISSVTEENKGTSEGSYYIVAVSYDDYKKLRLAEQYLNLWMNIAPSYNQENGPLLDAMRESTIKRLEDAQAQSKMKEVDNKKGKKDKKEKSQSVTPVENKTEETSDTESGEQTPTEKEEVNE